MIDPILRAQMSMIDQLNMNVEEFKVKTESDFNAVQSKMAKVDNQQTATLEHIVNKLAQIERQDFALEKEIQDLVESNVSELFNLQFISSEFQIGNFRLDTLCYDEDEKSFVIIEYKKGNSYSVVDQGLTYLSIIKKNKGDVILEYNETQSENLKRTDVEWDNLRIIFISQSFNTYQKNSINFMELPVELWEIKRFENGLISLNQLYASSQASNKSTRSTDKQSLVSKVLKDIQTFTEENHTSKSSSETVEIWETFKSKCQII